MVSLRGRHPLLYLAALALAAVVALAVFVSARDAEAQQQTATVTAAPSANVWQVAGSTGTTASIFTGGTVTFSDAANGAAHNVHFPGADPSSCVQTSGPANPDPIPPMPNTPSSAGWSGYCQFNSAGSYAFVCQAHAGMTGTVQVQNPPPGGGNPPPPPGGGNPPPGGGGGSGGGGGGGTDPGGSPTQPGSTSIKFARKQIGTTLRGSVTAAAGAKIVVTALVSNRYLSTSRPKKVKKVSVGSQTKRSTGAKVSFAVKLSKAARKALKRRDKLSVTLRIIVTPSGGKATTKTVIVRVRED